MDTNVPHYGDNLDKGHRSTRPRLRWLPLALALTLVATMAGPTAAADPDIDGVYDTVWTIPPACLTPNVPVVVTVKRLGSRSVQITLPEGEVFQGSIDADLNFDVSLGKQDWTGHFSLLSDGKVTMSGVSDDPELSCAGTTLRISIAGTRRGAPGPGTNPSTVPSAAGEAFSGLSAAQTAFETVCASHLMSLFACEGEVYIYANSWETAMDADIAKLAPSLTPEARASLDQLATRLRTAASMGALTLGACDGRYAAFPMVRVMLPAFGKLFVQAAIAAGQSRPADINTAVEFADALLLATANADTRRPPPDACSGPVP